jgi:hypothetical protein
MLLIKKWNLLVQLGHLVSLLKTTWDTVTRKRNSDTGAVKSSEDAKIARISRTLMYGVGNTLPLPVVSRRVKTKALLESCFSPDFSARHIEHTLKEQLEI